MVSVWVSERTVSVSPCRGHLYECAPSPPHGGRGFRPFRGHFCITVSRRYAAVTPQGRRGQAFTIWIGACMQLTPHAQDLEVGLDRRHA